MSMEPVELVKALVVFVSDKITLKGSEHSNAFVSETLTKEKASNSIFLADSS